MPDPNPILTRLELTGERYDVLAEPKLNSPNLYFEQLFPSHQAQFGPAFLELRESSPDQFIRITPISINLDFFASIFSDPMIDLSVVYFEPEMQFYYREPALNLYKPVSSEKLQNLYRGFLIRCAQSLNNDVNMFNLFHEFRSDKSAKAVVQRAKSVLAADHTYFSPTSPHQRIKGPELFERVARRFVDELLTNEPGQILKLADAFEVFRQMLKQRELPDIKRSDFKAYVGPLITEQFNVALRNDLMAEDKQNVKGWKNVKMLQSGPG